MTDSRTGRNLSKVQSMPKRHYAFDWFSRLCYSIVGDGEYNVSSERWESIHTIHAIMAERKTGAFYHTQLYTGMKWRNVNQEYDRMTTLTVFSKLFIYLFFSEKFPAKSRHLVIVPMVERNSCHKAVIFSSCRVDSCHSVIMSFPPRKCK